MNYYQRNNNYRNFHAEIFTDGSCVNNGQRNARGGIGVWWGHNDNRNISEPLYDDKPTNNKAEIQAAVRGINQAARLGFSSVAVNIDSEYLYNTVTKWIYDWRDNDWIKCDGYPVENVKYLIRILNAMDKIDVNWKLIPAHVGIKGNEEADRLAKMGTWRN